MPKTCPWCGLTSPDAATSCPCGHPLPPTEPTAVMVGMAVVLIGGLWFVVSCVFFLATWAKGGDVGGGPELHVVGAAVSLVVCLVGLLVWFVAARTRKR